MNAILLQDITSHGDRERPQTHRSKISHRGSTGLRSWDRYGHMTSYITFKQRALTPRMEASVFSTLYNSYMLCLTPISNNHHLLISIKTRLDFCSVVDLSETIFHLCFFFVAMQTYLFYFLLHDGSTAVVHCKLGSFAKSNSSGNL